MGLSHGVRRHRPERRIASAGGRAGQRALVIGASGFLGARLVERLVLERGAPVRALVRRVMAAAPLARLPVEVRVGDVADAAAVAGAVEGCSVVFNCAKGTGSDPERRRAVDVDGAGYVVEAARRAGARVVHVSSMVVYQLPRDGELDERAPDAAPGDPYTDNKLAGERRALELGARYGVPVTVIQPSVVYGPNGGVHGTEILAELRTGRSILVNGGTGICNAVYVDDVVTAMLLAAGADRAVGERFLISGPEHPTWREFYAGFERMLGVERTVSMTETEALELWRGSRRRSWLVAEAVRAFREDKALRGRLLATREGAAAVRLLGRLLPGTMRAAERWSAPAPHSAHGNKLPVSPLRPWLVSYLASKFRVRIDKARTLLGYQPVFRLEDGMRLTGLWARWAGLLG